MTDTPNTPTGADSNATKHTQEGAHTPRTYEQMVERRNKVFDWLEKTRVQRWCTADLCACNGCIQNSYDDIEITETEFIEWLQYKHATLTQQFTDYRKQSEEHLENRRNMLLEIIETHKATNNTQAATIKQSRERIERLEAALSRCAECNDLATSREYAKSALGGTEQ